MRRLSSWALLLALPFLLLLAVSATATGTPTRKLKHASGPITALAMDGPRVVYSTDGNGVYVWNVRSGATARVRIPSPSDQPLIGQVAIAGQRVAWITDDVAGNSMETNEDLFTASLSKAGKRKLAHAFRYSEFIEPQPTRGRWLWNGDWIGGLVGSGKLLAVSTWTTRPNADTGTETISNARLSLIGATGGLHPIVSGESAIVSRSTDGGQVAVLRPAGTVGIYSAAGALLRQITPTSAQEIALTGTRLVVLTKTKTLEVFDSKTGALTHTWPIKTRHAYLQAGRLRAYGRIALFSVDPRYSTRDLRILDLKTGRGFALPSRTRSGWNDASIGPFGLVYAVNSYKTYGGHHPSGTLVFPVHRPRSGRHPKKSCAQSRSGGLELRQCCGAEEKRGHPLRGFRGKNASDCSFSCGRTGRTSGGSELRATSGVLPGLLAASGSPTAPRPGTEGSAPSSTSYETMAATPGV
jgi:hypothetical protein